MNRILKFILVITLLTSVFQISAFCEEKNDIESISNYKAIDTSKTAFNFYYSNSWDNYYKDVSDKYNGKLLLLNNLGIMKGYEDGNFKPNVKITRAEFSTILAKLKYGENIASTSMLNFSDVGKDYWASSYISALKNDGVINGRSDTEFDPEGNITFQEAVKLIFSALGYDLIALNKGGYPVGYLNLAAENSMLSLKEGLDTDLIDRITVAKLITKAISIPFLDISAVSNDRFQLSDSKGNILENKKNIFKKIGLVEANDMTSIYSANSNLKEDDIIIDGQKYKSKIDYAKKLLGHTVEFYYQIDNDTNILTLLHAYPEDYDEVLIDYDRYINEDNLNNRISFYEDYSKKNRKDILVDANASIIYNGKYSIVNNQTSMQSYLNKFNNIRLIDNNNDGIYDVMFVEDYQTYVVKQVNVEQSIITLYENNITQPTVLRDLENDGNIRTVNFIKNDKIVDISAVLPNNVITYCQAKDNTITIVISDFSVSGEISEISREQNLELTINNKKYKLDRDYDNYLTNNNEGFNVSDKGVFYFDFIGNIAYCKRQTSISDQKYGYLFNMSISKGLDKITKAELLTMKNEFETFDFADKLQILYYPKYNPAAVYSGTAPNYCYDSVGLGSYIGYLDPVIRRRNNSLTYIGAYPNNMISSVAVQNQINLFRDSAINKSGKPSNIINEFFNSNVSQGTFLPNDDFTFDLEKIQLVRYKTSKDGKITEIEIPKDFGTPYQQVLAGDTQTQKQEAIEKDVFNISYKNYVFRDTSNMNLRAIPNRYTGLYRAVYENIFDDGTYNTARNTDYQNPLYFVKRESYVFNVPKYWNLNNNDYKGVSSNTLSTPINLNDFNIIRKEKGRYSYIKNVTSPVINADEYFTNTPIASEAYYDAINVDDMNETGLIVNYREISYLNPASSIDYVLVDKVSNVLNSDGDIVQKLYGYSLEKGRSFEGVSTYSNSFSRRMNQGGEFSQPYKRGDVIVVGKNFKETSYSIVKPLFTYDVNKLVMYNPLINTLFSPLSRFDYNILLNNAQTTYTLNNSLIPTDKYYYLTEDDFKGKYTYKYFFTNPPTNTTTNGYIVKDADVSNTKTGEYGHYRPGGTSTTAYFSGYVAGRVFKRSENTLKMNFNEFKILASGDIRQSTFNRLDTRYQRLIDDSVTVFKVKNNSISLATIDDISYDDFIFASIYDNKYNFIIIYENIADDIGR